MQDAAEILFRFAVAVLHRGVEVVHAGGDRPRNGALLVEWITAHHEFADRAGGRRQRDTGRTQGEAGGRTRRSRADNEALAVVLDLGLAQRRTVYAGSKLKPPTTREGAAWKTSLAAVLGKTRRTE